MGGYSNINHNLCGNGVRRMTKEEAIFCEKSYIGETNCTDCKYYIADTCLSRESHKMAIKACFSLRIVAETECIVLIITL